MPLFNICNVATNMEINIMIYMIERKTDLVTNTLVPTSTMTA